MRRMDRNNAKRIISFVTVGDYFLCVGRYRCQYRTTIHNSQLPTSGSHSDLPSFHVHLTYFDNLLGPVSIPLSRQTDHFYYFVCFVFFLCLASLFSFLRRYSFFSYPPSLRTRLALFLSPIICLVFISGNYLHDRSHSSLFIRYTSRLVDQKNKTLTQQKESPFFF